MLAEQGDAEAQYNLGHRYADGLGVAQDDAEAVRWYRLAADQGYTSAQYNLGHRYADDLGVAQDDAEAVRLFRLAADQGHTSAQHNLGVMYANGRGVPEDDAEAIRGYRLAANQGHASAQYNLGVMYDNGEGVRQDYVEAHTWLTLAAAQSSGEDRDRSVKARDGVAERMTSEQVAEAQRHTREWKPTPGLRQTSRSSGRLGDSRPIVVVASGGTGVTVHHAPVIALAAVVGITAFVPSTHLQAQQTLNELRVLAEQRNPEAQWTLGAMYSLGQGVTQDDLEAHIWFNLAAAQFSGENRERYVKARDAVAARITSEQIAEAQRRAREWTPTPEP